MVVEQPEIIRSEGSLRRQRQEFLERLNNLEFVPRRFDISLEEERREYGRFLSENQVIFVDSRLSDLVALYQRFHPRDKDFDSIKPQESLGFRSWLRNNNFTSPSRQGIRLAIPLDSFGAKPMWRIIVALPENLQRQLLEASAWKLMDSPNLGGETRRVLYEYVDMVIFGASVGGVIGATLVQALGVNNITFIDADIDEGTGDARSHDPRLSHHEVLKVIKLVSGLLESHPYLNYRIYPTMANKENVREMLKGIMPENPSRRLVVVEEVDSKSAKDEIRKALREMYPLDENVLLISAADIGRAKVGVVIETPLDPPYAGKALEFSDDPFGKGVSELSESDPRAILAEIMAAYGLITPILPDWRPIERENLRIPLELANALRHLLAGEIKSFEQSGLASRLAGVVAGTALLSWLEGHLSTKQIDVDISWILDDRWHDQEFLKMTLEGIRDLQKSLKIKKGY